MVTIGMRPPILCQRCKRRLWSPKLLRFWTSRSGSVPATEMVTERLLSKLSQLGQFGLAPAARPLLKPAGDDFSFSERDLGAAGGNH
jgi:hypothetical protein